MQSTEPPPPTPSSPGPHLLRAAAAKARSDAKARRARVLRHPDLAKRLTQRPLSYEQPEQWNGYIPPLHGPWGRATYNTSIKCHACGKWHDGHDVTDDINDSAQRAALVAIASEALARETADQQQAG